MRVVDINEIVALRPLRSLAFQILKTPAVVKKSAKPARRTRRHQLRQASDRAGRDQCRVLLCGLMSGHDFRAKDKAEAPKARKPDFQGSRRLSLAHCLLDERHCGIDLEIGKPLPDRPTVLRWKSFHPGRGKIRSCFSPRRRRGRRYSLIAKLAMIGASHCEMNQSPRLKVSSLAKGSSRWRDCPRR